LALAGGAAFWLAHTGVLLHCPRSDASALRHAAPGPPPPAASSAGGEVGDGATVAGGPEADGSDDGAGAVGSGLPVRTDGPDRDGFPDGGGVALGGAEVAPGVDGEGVEGVPTAADESEASDPEEPRADEVVPPSHAAASSANTPRRPTPVSRRRRRRWRLPRVAIDSIPVLAVPCRSRGERSADDR